MLRVNVKNGLKVKQLAKQALTLKTLMQKILVGLWVKNFTFSMLSSLNLNFCTTFFFLVQINCMQKYLGQILVAIEKLFNFTFSCLYARPIKVSLLKFWKLLGNYLATFNFENVNLLSNPNVKPQNVVGYKRKRVLESIE